MAQTTATPVHTATETTAQTAQPRPRRTPKLREVRQEDYPQIVSLSTEHGIPTGRSLEEWQHLWAANPAYGLVERDWPRGWVLEAEGRIVGYIGIIPSLYSYNNRQLLAAVSYCWVVENQYRGYSLFLLDRCLHPKGAELLISNTVNIRSYPSLVQLGLAPVPVGTWDHAAVWITNYSGLLTDWLARKKLRPAAVLAHGGALALSLKDTWNRTLLGRRAQRGIEVQLQTSFDERFDGFWEQLCRSYPGKLLALRTRPVLDWHYHYALRENRVWILTVSKGSDLQAYAVFVMTRPQAGSPVRRVLLADYQSLERNDGVYYATLRQALKQSAHLGCHLVSTSGFSASGTDTSIPAPYRPVQPNCIFLYKALNPDLAGTLTGPQAWCPSLYDADASL
jgi:hypothetical protein